MEKDANAIKNSVFALKKSFEIFMNDNLKPFKISSAQAKFLFILYENKKLRQSTLSKLAQCDKSYTHRVVKEFLEKKLITIENQWLLLTEDGKNLAKVFEKHLLNWHKKIVENIPLSQLKIVKNVLEEISRNALKIINNLE